MGIEFTNIWENAAVSQRCVIVHGHANKVPKGIASVVVWLERFPPQRFPMVNGYFKALVPLEEGQNRVVFESDVPGASNEKAELKLRYLPIKQNPPVHFVLILAKDSPGTFDCPPEKQRREGNDLGVAIRKLRMASYMMSAFTMEQMNRNNFGFRSFSPYSELEEDSLSNRDRSKRMTTHIHVVRSSKTLAEIRDPNRAQQNPKGDKTGDLFGIAYDDLRAYGGPFATNGFVQAAVIFLDAHWDPKIQLLVAHAALGGGIGNFKLAIFGSHTLHAWPSCIEDIPAACLDESRTDTNYIANDNGECGTSWESLCVGMGAFQHEIGHLLGCPHEPYGVMLRGYLNWNRSFVTLEGWSEREHKRALDGKPATADTEDGWHRLDIMRFRYHPSFKLPGEGHELGPGRKPLIYATRNGIAAQASGIYMVDIHVDGDSRHHIEYPLVPEVQLTLKDIQNVLPEVWRGRKRTDVHIHSVPMEQANVDNVEEFVHKADRDGVLVSSVAGSMNGDERTTLLPENKTPTSVVIWSGDGLDGVEFRYAGGSSIVFGKTGGSPKEVRIEPGDVFVGICVRSGAWVDAGGVITRHARSPVWGGPGGGEVDLVPPKGYTFRGLRGWFGNWCNGIAVVY